MVRADTPWMVSAEVTLMIMLFALMTGGIPRLRPRRR